MSRVVCFDGHLYPDWQIANLFKCGCESYIDIRQGWWHIDDTLESVPQGDFVIPQNIQNLNCDLYRLPDRRDNITENEIKLIQLTTTGLDSDAIAKLLDVKAQTIFNRRNALYKEIV